MQVTTTEAVSYSGTYLGNSLDMRGYTGSALVHPVVAKQSVEVPFVGGTLALSSQAVGMRLNDNRIPYTNLEAQVDSDGVICEDVQTFGGPRSKTDGWSSRIQRRMFLTIRQLDLAPIRNSPDPLALIVFKFPKTIRTNRELVNKEMDRLIAAIKYKLGGMRAYPLVWNIEFHWDENAHFNFLLAFPSSSYEWLLKKWTKIAKFSADAKASDVLNVTRFADFDEAGNELSFEDKFYNAAAYMAGLGPLLGHIKAHQYDVPEDWAAAGEGSGRMWGARGLGRAKISTYPIENLAQKQAIDEYMAIHCPEKLSEYRDPKTGEVTIFNDGSFSPTRRAGSIQCLAVTEQMNEDLLDLLELYATPEHTDDLIAEISVGAPAGGAQWSAPALWEREDYDADAFLAWLDEAESDDQDFRGELAAEAEVLPYSALLALLGITEDNKPLEAPVTDFLAERGFSSMEQRKAERTARRKARKAMIAAMREAEDEY